jgi:hypothetical protein
MHKKICPEKDSYIEKSSEYYLKNFGRDELLAVSAPEFITSRYVSFVNWQNIDDIYYNLHVELFTGTITGSAVGTGSNIVGVVNSCDGMVIVDPPYVPSASLFVYLLNP